MVDLFIFFNLFSLYSGHNTSLFPHANTTSVCDFVWLCESEISFEKNLVLSDLNTSYRPTAPTVDSQFVSFI